MKVITFLKMLRIETWANLKISLGILLLLFGVQASAQNSIPLPPEASCTSKDLEVVGARLNLDPCFKCEIGGGTQCVLN